MLSYTDERTGDPTVLKRFLRWLVPDRRRRLRHVMPPLIAFLGVVDSSKPYEVSDVSSTGFFMRTEDHWLPGTYMPVSLKRTDPASAERTDFITVQAVVVRNAGEGVGFAFLLADDASASPEGLQGAHWVSKAMMEEFLNGLRQSRVETSDTLARAS